jgi:alcohol dehydrogenase (cytochrome c)
MSAPIRTASRLFAITIMLLAPALLRAQGGLDPRKAIQPLAEQWSTYSGDYTGKRYSSLREINRENVHNLSLAWVTRFTAGSGASGKADSGLWASRVTGGTLPFPTIVGGLGSGDLNVGGPAGLSGAILQVDGILYVSAPDNAWAVDARDGSIIWHYYWKTRGGTHTGNRGLGMYGHWLFMELHDDMLVSLDARTGKERWHKEIASFEGHYFASNAPIVIGHHVLVGTGNDLDAPGFLQSFDPETGERQWISYTVPMKADDPGIETWASLDAARHGGGHAWVPGSYDPETHLYIFGTGNPTPAWTTGTRGEGDNLFTCSLIAVDIETGKMVWHYQTSPHDTHDWDATQTPVLVDAPFGGRPRKLVMQATRNGYFFVLDRVTGEHLLTSKLGKVNNWASHLDREGHPRRNPQKDATVPGSLVNSTVAEWRPPTFSPDTGLFYTYENDSLEIAYLMDVDPRGSMGLGGVSEFGSPTLDYGTAIVALNYQNGEVRWRRDIRSSAGLLSTAGQLLFSGDDTYLIAYDVFTGNLLWHARIGVTGTAPETYAVDGRQYLLAAGGDQLFAFVLNKPEAGAARTSAAEQPSIPSSAGSSSSGRRSLLE